MQESRTSGARKLKDQVIIITGACNPVGRSTARMAAIAGARIVLVSENEAALQQLNNEISLSGTTPMYVIADVGREADIKRIAQSVIRTHGTYDTWVNIGDVSSAGRISDVPPEVLRRVFDRNFWGVVYGSRISLDHFRQAGHNGIFISAQNLLNAADHAIQDVVNGAINVWLGALQEQTQNEEVPLSISSALTWAMNPPAGHRRQRRKRREEAEVLTPEAIAKAILDCAENPKDKLDLTSRAGLGSVIHGFASTPGVVRSDSTDADQENKSDPLTLRQRAGQAKSLIKKNRLQGRQPGRAFFSSIALAGLGAGMWLLSRPRKPS